MIECRAPKSKKEFQQYYQLRWLVLRAPWLQPEGSERDELEQQAIHRAVYDGKQLVAVGRLHFVEQTQAQIRYMAVSESAQGHGYGKLLLDSLEQEAQRRGATRIVLQAREVALGFYQDQGYQQKEKSHLLYQQIQHYRMEKTLAPLTEHQASQAMALQQVWHQTIPLSKAMNIAISYYDGEQLSSHCDPLFNKNLHNTMFAGSIYTLATLTGWGWVYFQLVKHACQGDIVLADANIKYLAPIAGVACGQTTNDLTTGDSSPLLQQKKARFNVEVHILSGDKVAAIFTGQYVVLPKND